MRDQEKSQADYNNEIHQHKRSLECISKLPKKAPHRVAELTCAKAFERTNQLQQEAP